MIKLKSSALFENMSGSQFYFTVQKNNNVMINYSFEIPHNLSPNNLSDYSHHAGVAIGQSGKCG